MKELSLYPARYRERNALFKIRNVFAKHDHAARRESRH
jgi:hypothetical protein